MNYNFHLLSKLEKLSDYYQKILINFPNKEIILKQNIEKNLYEMLECVFAFNINDTTRIKQKYLKDFLIKLSMLDHYTRISFNKKCISIRQNEVICRKIIELRKIYYGVSKIFLIEKDKDEL